MVLLRDCLSFLCFLNQTFLPFDCAPGAANHPKQCFELICDDFKGLADAPDSLGRLCTQAYAYLRPVLREGWSWDYAPCYYCAELLRFHFRFSWLCLNKSTNVQINIEKTRRKGTFLATAQALIY